MKSLKMIIKKLKTMFIKRQLIKVGVILLFIISLTVPVCINNLYEMGAKREKEEKAYITYWGADDVLAFYGTYLSFIGTVVLGIAAIHQNEKTHQLNQQMQKLQQAELVSMVSVVDIDVYEIVEWCPDTENDKMGKFEIIDLIPKTYSTNNFYHIDVKFKNNSNFPIVQIDVRAAGDDLICSMHGINEIKERAIYISENGEQAIRFIVPGFFFESTKHYKLALRMRFVNVFDYKTVATLHLDNIKTFCSNKEYKYRIAKFIDVH